MSGLIRRIGELVHWPQGVLRFETRRRILGFLRRKLRWEFWPVWAAYAPLLPYWLYLALRHRSATVFLDSNPGMPMGGLVGESKSAILKHFVARPEFSLRFTTIPEAMDPKDRLVAASDFLERCGLDFPVVVKPDVGERGKGVTIVRSQGQLDELLQIATEDVILQEYAEGLEFGVFYYRIPGEIRGRVLSITAKQFPVVIGDGSSSLGRLILADERAVCLWRAYFEASRMPLDRVPAACEAVRLVELGSHCRGSVFLDARHLLTADLEAAVDRAAKAHPGFYFGRFDVRSPSEEDFQKGRFRILELNGVSAEATHVYDPRVSLFEAYRTMSRVWRLAFEIGAENRRIAALAETQPVLEAGAIR